MGGADVKAGKVARLVPIWLFTLGVEVDPYDLI